MFDVRQNLRHVEMAHIDIGSSQDFDAGQWGTINADGELIEVSGEATGFPLYQVFSDSDKPDVEEADRIPYVRGEDYQGVTTQYDSTASYSVGDELVVTDGVLAGCPSAVGAHFIVGIYVGTETTSDDETAIVFDKVCYRKDIA